MAGLAGQKVRITDTGYTTHTAGQKLRAADTASGVVGTPLKASQK